MDVADVIRCEVVASVGEFGSTGIHEQAMYLHRGMFLYFRSAVLGRLADCCPLTAHQQFCITQRTPEDMPTMACAMSRGLGHTTTQHRPKNMCPTIRETAMLPLSRLNTASLSLIAHAPL